MGDWQEIQTIPAGLKDGRSVWVRRVYDGETIAEGKAVFAVPHPTAPMLQPLLSDPLGRLSAADYASEAQARGECGATAQWLDEGRMYAFPDPTHWRDSAPTPSETMETSE